jgi:hypothetical protein
MMKSLASFPRRIANRVPAISPHNQPCTPFLSPSTSREVARELVEQNLKSIESLWPQP